MILELHLIGEEKLKVLLTPFDMMKYNLTCEKLDYENTETRKALWNILDRAKHETGFDAAQGRICIEVFPEKNGGCAIYITKLKKSDAASSEGIDLGRDAAHRGETRALYRFEDAEALLRVCGLLSTQGYALPSRAFFEERTGTGARYYLELCERPLAVGGKKARYLREHLFISEFGTRLDGDTAPAFLHEHCTVLCEENAVGTLSPLA
ncbi:MAG: adaptor protein MecA [Clostridia bacterium]|nr:adaptor protein MecA [Clostridia bacterium]